MSAEAAPLRISRTREYRALVDTGAQMSAVDVTLAAALDLPVVDRRVYAGAGGMFKVNVHGTQLSMPVIVLSVRIIFAVAVQPLRDVWVLTKKHTVTNQLVIHGTPVIRFNFPLAIAASSLLGEVEQVGCHQMHMTRAQSSL